MVVDAGVTDEPVPIDAATITLLTPTQVKPTIETPHGGGITDVAVTADGTAAVTTDDLGGHRLWPALDGSIEPRVIELPAPSQLALGRDPKGFLIALIDEAGGLVLQQVNRDGQLVQRATLPLEPTFKGIAMTERGPLAWRTDQRIVRLAADGSITSQLAAEQGQRVLHIAVPAIAKPERALAVIEGSVDTTTWRRARWLELGDKLAWGGWIDAGDAIEPNLAVAPDLSRFAFIAPPVSGVPRITVINIVDGKSIYSENAFNATAIEMPDPDHVVYSGAGGQTIWLDINTKKTRNLVINQLTNPGVLAIGAGKSFSANGGELVIGNAIDQRYLGYALQASQVAAAGSGDQLVITWGDRAALLDGKLHAQPLSLFPANHTINALRWLTGTEWLVQAVRVDNATTTLAVVDIAQRSRAEVRTNLPAGQLSYEPSTKLAGASFGLQPEVFRHTSKRLESVAIYPKPPPYDRVLVYPVSPALAGGTQIVTAHSKDTTTLRWVPDARALDKGTAMTIDGAVAAIDAAGKVYAWTSGTAGAMELALLRDGKRVGVMTVERGTRAVWPDAKGERVLVSHTTGLTLYNADGKTAWTRPIAGITQALWLDDGAIAVITGLGIVRLDGATGEPQVTRCGWLFELASTPHAARTRVEPMCTKR